MTTRTTHEQNGEQDFGADPTSTRETDNYNGYASQSILSGSVG